MNVINEIAYLKSKRYVSKSFIMYFEYSFGFGVHLKKWMLEMNMNDTDFENHYKYFDKWVATSGNFIKFPFTDLPDPFLELYEYNTSIEVKEIKNLKSKFTIKLCRPQLTL